MLLSISMVLPGCSSKDNEEITNTEKQVDITESEDENIVDIDKKDDIEEGKKEDIEDTEEAEEKDEVEERTEDTEEKIEEVEEKDSEKKEEDTKSPEESNPKEETKPKEESESIEEREPKEESNTEEDKKAESPEEAQEGGLKIEGKVEKELALSLDGLKEMKDLIFKGKFYSLNNFGTTAHTEFKGVNLWRLLDEKAKISSHATKVRIIATDGYEMEFAVEAVKRQDYIDETDPEASFPMIIAWEEDGEEYDPDYGVPFKLVVGQKEPGDTNKPQWVSNIDKIVVE